MKEFIYSVEYYKNAIRLGRYFRAFRWILAVLGEKQLTKDHLSKYW